MRDSYYIIDSRLFRKYNDPNTLIYLSLISGRKNIVCIPYCPYAYMTIPCMLTTTTTKKKLK